MRSILTIVSVARVAASTLQVVPYPGGAVPTPTPQQLKYGGSISALIHFNMVSGFVISVVIFTCFIYLRRLIPLY